MTRDERIEAYVKAHAYERSTAFVLALVLGPIGYLYANPWGGLIMLGLIFGAAGLFLPLGMVMAVICWLTAVIMAPIDVESRNEQIRARAQLLAGGD